MDALGVPLPRLIMAPTNKVGYLIPRGRFKRKGSCRPESCRVPLPISYAGAFGEDLRPIDGSGGDCKVGRYFRE